MFGKPTAYLGVDIGAGGIKLVEFHREKKRPVLFTYGLTAGAVDVHQLAARTELTAEELAEKKTTVAGLQETPRAKKSVKAADKAAAVDPALIDPERIEQYADLLKAVCASAKTRAKVAVASLPVSGVFHAIVTLPILKKEESDAVLKAEVRKLLPFRLEDVVLDSQVLAATTPGQKTQRVLVNAVPRSLVLFYTQIFKQAGLTLESLEPESIALSRALIGRDSAPTMLVDVGAERTNFFIIDQSVPITHNSIEVGGNKLNDILARRLGVEVPLAEQMKKDFFLHFMNVATDGALKREQFFEFFNPVVDPIVKEIAYSLELYMRQSDNQEKRPEKIVLTGGAAFFPYLADHISETFKLKCYIGDPWGRVVYPESLRPVLRSIAPRMAVAIGLALRNMV